MASNKFTWLLALSTAAFSKDLIQISPLGILQAVFFFWTFLVLENCRFKDCRNMISASLGGGLDMSTVDVF